MFTQVLPSIAAHPQHLNDVFDSSETQLASGGKLPEKRLVTSHIHLIPSSPIVKGVLPAVPSCAQPPVQVRLLQQAVAYQLESARHKPARVKVQMACLAASVCRSEFV